MSERIAIRFVNKEEGIYGKSVVLYSHNGDIFVRDIGQEWIKNLPPKTENYSDPITRREVSALVPEFMKSEFGYLIDRIHSPDTIYTNLNHGFWEIDVFTGKATEIKTDVKEGG